MGKIIDLKKTNLPMEPEKHEIMKKPEPPLPALPHETQKKVEWKTYEHLPVMATDRLKIILSIILGILLLISLFARNYTFIAFLVLAFALLMVYMKRSPKEITCSIDAEGVRAGTKLFLFAGIQSFWIFDRPDWKELSLETKNTFSPYLRLPLGDADITEIKKLLSSHISEKEHPESGIDSFLRNFGF